MLLSSGANPRQANTKGKNPTDCVYSKEMSEVFSSHGVQLPATRMVDGEFSSSCNIDRNCDGKTIPESTKSKNVKGQSEQCNKGSILRNEIQRKQTQGESKMEKPVMYICKLTSGEYDQEITVRTTQAIQPLQDEPGGDELEFDLGTETEVHAGLSGDESFTLERREKAGELPKCRSGKVTGNILTSSEEVRSEKERPAKTGVVSQLAENVSSSVLDQQGKRPLQKESITNEQNEYGEVLSRKHSSGPAQAIAQMSFKARLLRHQEAETPALKESQDKGKVKDINPLEKDEREILVNSEQSDMNTKENQNPEEDVEGQISRSSHSSLENSHLSFQTVPLHVNISPDINGAANENKVCRKTEITYAVRDEREVLITPKQDDQDTKGFGSKVSCVENKTEQITDISHEAASQEQIMPNDSPNQIESHQIDEMDKAVHVRDQSQEERHPGIENSKGSERIPSGCSPMVSKPRRPPITWRSLLAGNGCKLSELRIPYYDQFLINTKDYELSNGVVNSERLQVC